MRERQSDNGERQSKHGGDWNRTAVLVARANKQNQNQKAKSKMCVYHARGETAGCTYIFS